MIHCVARASTAACARVGTPHPSVSLEFILQAYLALGRAVTALDIAQLGLEAEPSNAVLITLAAEATAARNVQRANEAATRVELAAREASLSEVRAAASARGVRVGPPLFQDQRRTAALPYVSPAGSDDAGALHWPVLLLYPEYGTSDYLEDVAEGAQIAALLDVVLPDGGAAAAWDRRPGEYTASNVAVFMRTNMVVPGPLASAWAVATPGGNSSADADATDVDSIAPLGATDLRRRWLLVQRSAVLGEVLSHPEYVVPDVPVLYVVARTSDYYAELRRRCGGAFASLETYA